MAPAALRARLEHILEAISLIEAHTAGKTFEQYAADPLLQAAVERWLLTVSEATRFVPDEHRQRHPEIPWRSVADLGNVLRHAYDRVFASRVWAVVEEHLLPLRSAVEAMLAEPRAGDEVDEPSPARPADAPR